MKFWVIMVAILISCTYLVTASRSEVRLFCSYGRLFIEFQDGYSVWGTMMLDNDGIPIQCNDEKVNTKLQETI